MPVFGGEALPSKCLREAPSLFFRQPIYRANVRRAMDTGVDALTPSMGLEIEIVQISEDRCCPHALLHVGNGALDFSFCLGRIRLADPCGDRDRDHEIGKTRIPAWFVFLHFQYDALHAVGEYGLCRSEERRVGKE